MDRDDPAGEVLVAHAPPTGLLHEACQLPLVGPGQDRLAQVVVGLGVRRDQAGRGRQGAAQVEAVQVAEGRPDRGGELRDDDPPARHRHPAHLRQCPRRVLHVAQPVGDGDDVEALIGEGQRRGVPGHEGDLGVAALALGHHAGGEVAGHDLGAVGGVLHRGGAGPRGQIQDSRSRPRGDGRARHLAPHVHLEQAHHVIGQVVAARNGVEHPGDLARVLGEAGSKGGSAHGGHHRKSRPRSRSQGVPQTAPSRPPTASVPF